MEQVDLVKAQAELERKREGIRRQRENTLVSVKTLLSTDLEAARTAANTLRDTKEFNDAVNILQDQPRPNAMCDKCGTEKPVRFSVSELKFIVIDRCHACSEREETEKRDRDIQRAIQQFHDRIDSALSDRGVPERYLCARVEHIPQAHRGLVDEKRGIYLCGYRGVGKTHLACAIMRAVALQVKPRRREYGGYTVSPYDLPMFVTEPDLFLEITDTFGNREKSVKQVIDKYSSPQLLVFDDLGLVDTSNNWVYENLYALINKRYERMLRTIFTSNLSLQDLGNKLGDRIASRIAETCVLKVLKGDDRRLKMRDGKACASGESNE